MLIPIHIKLQIDEDLQILKAQTAIDKKLDSKNTMIDNNNSQHLTNFYYYK